MNRYQIARVAHEVNRAYCAAIGDTSQVPFDEAPQWQIESAMESVQYRINNPEATPEDGHANWLRFKALDGWKYGPVKDADKKEHPCFLPYAELPKEQRVKDHLFLAVVGTLKTPE